LAFYNDNPCPNPDPNRPSQLRKVMRCLNRSCTANSIYCYTHCRTGQRENVRGELS